MTRPLTLARWRDAAVGEFAAGHHYKPRDLKRAQNLLRSLFAHLEGCGITDPAEVTEADVVAWINAAIVRRDGSVGPPAHNTARYRQYLAKFAFRVAARLGVAVDPAAVTGDPIKWGSPDVSSRALTEDEVQRVCASASSRRKTSQKRVLVALSRAGGSAPELPNVRRRDVDLDAATVKFTGPNARTCALDPWSVDALAEYLSANAVALDDLLCVDADTAPESAAHSVSARLHRIVCEAGLNDPDVTARSIRLTEAHKVLRHKGIAAAARFLGASSLDATTEMLNHQWRQPAALDEEPSDE